MLEEWQETESDLASAQAHPRGRLRVDMGAAMAAHVVIPALPAFQARYPDLQLDIGASDRPVDLISDGVDCVVRAGRVTDPSLIARHIGDLPFVLCATPGYIERHGEPAHPDDLAQGHTLVRYFFAGPTRQSRQSTIELRSGEERVSVQGRCFVSVNDANALLAAGLAGLGVLHTLAAIVQPSIDEGKLVRLLPGWSADPIPISIAYPLNRHLSARVRVFVDWMVEIFKA